MVNNWICIIWITMDERNILEHLKLQYKLFIVIFKLKYVRRVVKLALFRDCLNVCKTLIPLMSAVEAHNLAKNCTKYCLLEINSKKCAIIWGLVTIATWLIQSYPYPQCSPQILPCKAKHITHCLNWSVYVYVSGHYRYTNIFHKLLSEISTLNYVRTLLNSL